MTIIIRPVPSDGDESEGEKVEESYSEQKSIKINIQWHDYSYLEYVEKDFLKAVVVSN